MLTRYPQPCLHSQLTRNTQRSSWGGGALLGLFVPLVDGFEVFESGALHQKRRWCVSRTRLAGIDSANSILLLWHCAGLGDCGSNTGGAAPWLCGGGMTCMYQLHQKHHWRGSVAATTTSRRVAQPVLRSAFGHWPRAWTSRSAAIKVSTRSSGVLRRFRRMVLSRCRFMEGL